VYGASEFRLQQELIRVGQSQYQAKQSTRKYLQSMEKIGIADYQKKLLTFADKYGYNYSIYGRIGERLNPTQVVNFPVQSFSADLNKIRIIQMYNKLREHNLLSRIWLEFHDAMELDVYKPELDTILKLIKEIDTTIPDLENNNIKLDLPLDIKYDRKNWS
jgi:DNA polymerase-1